MIDILRSLFYKYYYQFMAADEITQIAVVIIAGLAVFFLLRIMFSSKASGNSYSGNSYVTGKKSPEVTVLEQELESLYHEVAGEKDLFPRTEESETPAGVTLPYASERPLLQEGNKQKNRFSLIVSMVAFFALMLAFMAIVIWPTILYGVIDYMVCLPSIIKPTIKSVMAPPIENTKLKGQTESSSALPAPSSVTKEASTKPDAQPTAVSPVPSGFAKEASKDQDVPPTTNLPIEEKKLKDQTEEISPADPPKVTKRGKYAIQIIAYPGARKKDAMAFAKDLRKTQPDVYVERVNTRKRGVWYRILTGHFTSSEDANNYMKEKKILEAHPGSFVQLKSEGRSPRTKPE